MTFTALATPSAYAGAPKRGPVTRLLEDERWLAMVLLQNFAQIWQDDIFHVAVWNTCVYTALATVFKLALGLWLALLLNHHFKGKAITRAFILLPFIIPTV